jgi:hypothetical protein
MKLSHCSFFLPNDKEVTCTCVVYQRNNDIALSRIVLLLRTGSSRTPGASTYSDSCRWWQTAFTVTVKANAHGTNSGMSFVVRCCSLLFFV